MTRRLADLAPGVPAVQLRLAEYASAVGDVATAKSAMSAALAVNSTKAHRYHCRVAALLLRLRELDAAEACLENIKASYPASVRLWGIWGELYRYRGNPDEAARRFERALALATSIRDRLEALAGLADCCADTGRKDDAVSISRRMIELAPDEGAGYHHLVHCQDALSACDDAIQPMLRTLSSPTTCQCRRMSLHYSLGTAYDGCGHYGDAFAHFLQANAIRAQLRGRFDVPSWQKQVEARITVFGSQLIAEMSEHGCRDEFLICIVGMPRSGTTLIEQVLGSHPDVAALGERADFYKATQDMRAIIRSSKSYPRCCTRMSGAHVAEMAVRVKTQLLASAGGRSRVVTKLPGDAWELGFIKILFPRARFIHCRRHPIDNCLSCYMQNFGSILFSTDLATLAEVYRLHRRVMSHWQQVLPTGTILECSYEGTVADPEPVVRRLHEHCGIAFNENWLRFTELARRVDTASKWQVRRPIYQTSVARWKNYAPFLGPLLALEGESEISRAPGANAGVG